MYVFAISQISGASASSAPAKRTSPPPASSASAEGNASKRNRRQVWAGAWVRGWVCRIESRAHHNRPDHQQTKLNEVKKAALPFNEPAVLPFTNNLCDQLAMSKGPEQSRLIAQHTLKQLMESHGWDFLSQTYDMYRYATGPQVTINPPVRHRYNRPPALSPLPLAAPASSHASPAMDPTRASPAIMDHASSDIDHASPGVGHASPGIDHAPPGIDHASSILKPGDDYSPELLNELIDGIGISGDRADSAAAAEHPCVTPPTHTRAATAASDNAAPTDKTPIDTTPVAAAAATMGLCPSPHPSPSPKRMLDHAAVDTPVAHDPTHSVPMIPENQMPPDFMLPSRREEERGLGYTESYNI